MKKLEEIRKNNIQSFWKKCKNYLAFIYEGFFHNRPKYLYPFIVLLIFFLIVLNVALTINHKILNLFPKEFSDWSEFNSHVESIIKVLRDTNETYWADMVYQSLYVSQSFYERRGELLQVLPKLKSQPFVRKMGINNEIEKAISYLNSFKSW